MRVAAVVLVGLLLSACGAVVPGSSAPDVSRVSFVQEPELSMMALATGVLGGDPATGCLWLEGRDGDHTPLLMQHDTAVLDVTAQPPVVRDGERVLAAFGDVVDVGGGHVSQSLEACPGLDGHFLGHGLARPLPGRLPQASLRAVRLVCDGRAEPRVAGELVVEGVPRLPLLVDVAGPAGQERARRDLPATEGLRALDLPMEGLPDGPYELILSVSEGAQALVQEIVLVPPGPVCG